MPLALLEDQDRGFARDARDFAVNVFVDDQIRQYQDPLAGKAREQVKERGTIGSGNLHFLTRLRARSRVGRSRVRSSEFDSSEPGTWNSELTNCVLPIRMVDWDFSARIFFTASRKFSTTRSGGRSHPARG